MKSGIIKYKSTNDKTSELAFCSKAGFYYINRTANEFQNCDGYKIPYTLKQADCSIETLGECLITCNTLYPYYNIKDKLCQKNGNLKILKKVNSDGNFTLGASDEGNCVSECPFDYIYESSDGTLCYDKCSTNTVDYDAKKCVFACTSTQYWSKVGDVTYCLGKCTHEFGSFIAVGNECFKSCSEKDLVANFVDKTCVCPNLYILDESDGKTICLDVSTTTCGKDSKNGDYKYR